MWITLLVIPLVWVPSIQAGDCQDVLTQCQDIVPWTRCYEDEIATCTARGRGSGIVRLWVNSFQEVEVRPTLHHRVHIPSSALQRSRGAAAEDEVIVVASMINSTLFKLIPTRKGKGRRLIPAQPTHRQGTVMGGFVLQVRAGNHPVSDLSQPVKLTFSHNGEVADGTCVFWQESNQSDGTGHWSTDGCNTSNTGTEFICSCNHLSFFAVLVNPELSVDQSNTVALTYITYIGSALSVLFTIFSLIIYSCLQRRRPEKAIGVHMHLTGALLCLHLTFLLCSFWVWLPNMDWVCQGLGLFLHWSLLAVLSWMALEGFHLYLLLVRVFNIYVRRYLLKLSLVGWGLPTLTVVVCGLLRVYGKYTLRPKDHNSTTEICWIRNEFQLVSYITNVAFPCLVTLCNFLLLGLVVFKLWERRRGMGGLESTSAWKKMDKEKWTRLWKDCATVLGLSCVLGLTWGLASTTYISLPGIYAFTVLNSLQGVFMFLWSMALSRKYQSDNNSSIRDQSSQKMMTTSFNN